MLTFFIDKRAPGNWDDCHIVDGRLVTEQNPASSKFTAEAVIKAFNQL